MLVYYGDPDSERNNQGIPSFQYGVHSLEHLISPSSE
mgnify:CR=1 FL=1